MGCVGTWGVGLWGCGVLWGLGGLVLGLRGDVVGLGRDGFWDMILGYLGGTGWVRVLIGRVFGPGGLCWGM